jgi:hypothetical protein
MVNWRRLRLDGDAMCNPLRIGMVNGLACLQDEEAGSFQIDLQSNDQTINLDSAVEKISLGYVLD